MDDPALPLNTAERFGTVSYRDILCNIVSVVFAPFFIYYHLFPEIY